MVNAASFDGDSGWDDPEEAAIKRINLSRVPPPEELFPRYIDLKNESRCEQEHFFTLFYSLILFFIYRMPDIMIIHFRYAKESAKNVVLLKLNSKKINKR